MNKNIILGILVVLFVGLAILFPANNVKEVKEKEILRTSTWGVYHENYKDGSHLDSYIVSTYYTDGSWKDEKIEYVVSYEKEVRTITTTYSDGTVETKVFESVPDHTIKVKVLSK